MATFIVTTLADVVDANDGLTSLREAIALANANAGADTIEFDAGLNGTIRLDGGDGVGGTVGGTLSITEAVTIDGDGRILISGDVAGDDTTVGATDITDIFNTAAANLDDNVRIISATADLTLDGLTLTGGMTSGDGGAVSAANNTVTLTNSMVSGNSAGNEGGGIFASTANLTNSTISGNTSDEGGGGIRATAANLINSTLSGNSAGIDGGGIFASTANLTNSTVSGNSADVSGGGIYAADTANLTNSTVSGNSADFGGGVFADTANLTNSIVLGNGAGVDGDEVSAVTTSLAGGNIVGDTFTIDGGSPETGITLGDVFASVTANPHTGVMSGTLADNGGPVETIALNTATTNPTLDAGDDDAAGVSAADARGLARHDVSGVANNGANISDLGAFEAQAETPSLVVTTLDDVVNDLDGLTSLREAIAYANANAGADTITFDPSLGAGGTITFGSDVPLDDDATIDVGVMDITLAGGGLAGAGALTKDGTGTLTLSAASSYSGGTHIDGGTLQVAHIDGFGSIDVLGTGAVTFDGGTLQRPAESADNALYTLDLGISLDAGGGTFDTQDGELTSFGDISGAGGLTKIGAGELLLRSDGTYTGATNINEGVLTAGFGNAIGDMSAVTVVAGATLVVAGTETIGSLSGDGTVENGSLLLPEGHTLTVGANDGDATFSGTLINGLSELRLIKIGDGTQILSGINSYTGDTAVNGGVLQVDGSITNSAARVNDGGTLGGNGATGAVTVMGGGTLSPGASAGILSTGAIVFAAASIFKVELGGTNPGTGYDQLDVTGTVDLGGATLDLFFIGGFKSSTKPGQTFTIIENDGNDAVQGAFAGLADDATLNFGGRAFIIDYDGGDGNDVTLTSAPIGGVRIVGTNGGDLVDATHTVPGEDLPTEFDDIILGRGGRDRLSGLDGDDVLIGGRGRDIMKGGGSGDIFDFNHIAESRVGSQRDKILAFDSNDLIDLRTIDAKVPLKSGYTTASAERDARGHDDFKWIGRQDFSGKKGELRYEDKGAKVIVQADTDGDGKPDFDIWVGTGSLAKSDFLL